jgi:hypothetical protein
LIAIIMKGRWRELRKPQDRQDRTGQDRGGAERTGEKMTERDMRGEGRRGQQDEVSLSRRSEEWNQQSKDLENILIAESVNVI